MTAMFPAIYRTKKTDPKNGLPNVVAFMFSEKYGCSVQGGSMAPFSMLDFGEPGTDTAFKPEDWEMLVSTDEIVEIASHLG